MEKLIGMAPFILMIGIMYLLVIRPNQKRQKEHQALLNSLKKGDKIITNGGIVAVVNKLNKDETVELEISKETYIVVQRQSIAMITEKVQ